MIIQGTRLRISDNSGAKEVECIHVLGGTKKKYAAIGQEIVASVKEATPKGNINKGDVVRAVIVRGAKEVRREDGTYIRFSENAAVVINKEGEPRCTRVFGPVASELRKKYPKIVSLAPETV